MSAFGKLLAGAAGLLAVAGFASPAAAQYYPGYGYNSGGVLGAIVNSVVGNQYGYGYGNYGYGASPQYAVSQCSRAVEARLGGGYGGYGYGNYGYGGGVRVTSVERRNSGVRVHGLASSGGGYGGYGGNISFSCKVDYNGRISDLNFDQGYGYNGYYRGY